jgi:hypothetical protein
MARRLRRRIRSIPASARAWFPELAGDGQRSAATIRATADLSSDSAARDFATTIGTFHVSGTLPVARALHPGRPPWALPWRIRSAKSDSPRLLSWMMVSSSAVPNIAVHLTFQPKPDTLSVEKP